ncbi:hypothetical protein ACQY0O_003790 [Thecaphora frezii]
MGCAICLDGFSQDASDRQRPTALACGHLFHSDCLAQWQQNSARSKKTKGHVCSLCKAITPEDRLIKLYPTESGDLDHYLAYQNVEIDQRLLAPPEADDHDRRDLAGAREKATLRDEEEAKKLLGSLLDLGQHLQDWVMGVHGVRVDTVMRSGLKIKKLVADLTDQARRAQNSRDDLEKSLSSLEAAVASLDARREAFREAENEVATYKRRLKAKALSVHQEAKQAHEQAHALQAQLEDLQQQRKSLEDIIQKAEASVKEQQAREAALSERAAAIDAQARELDAQRRQMRLETAQKLRLMERSMQEKSKEADEKVAESSEKEKEATREREAVMHKNHLLADQLRHLQNEVKKARMKLDKQSDEAKEVSRLRTKLAETQQQLKRERMKGIAAAAAVAATATAESGVSQQPSRSLASSTFLSSPYAGEGDELGEAPSSSPTPGTKVIGPNGSPVTPSDRVAVASTAKEGGASLTLPQSSLLIESEDLDDELFQDSLYPMPGFGGALRDPDRSAFARTFARTSSGSSNFAPFAPFANTIVEGERDKGKERLRTKAAHGSRETHRLRVPAISHQSTIRFHRSSSDGAVRLEAPLPRQPAAEKRTTDQVIDLTASSPIAVSEGKENSRTVPGAERQEERKRQVPLTSLHSWIEGRNGVVLGPKRKRKD